MFTCVSPISAGLLIIYDLHSPRPLIVPTLLNPAQAVIILKSVLIPLTQALVKYFHNSAKHSTEPV